MTKSLFHVAVYLIFLNLKVCWKHHLQLHMTSSHPQLLAVVSRGNDISLWKQFQTERFLFFPQTKEYNIQILHMDNISRHFSLCTHYIGSYRWMDTTHKVLASTHVAMATSTYFKSIYWLWSNVWVERKRVQEILWTVISLDHYKQWHHSR